MKKNYICPTIETIIAESFHICAGSKQLTWHVDSPQDDSHKEGDTETNDWGFIRFDQGKDGNKGYDAWDSDNW